MLRALLGGIATSLVFMLAACGGGGGGDDAPPVTQADNRAPRAMAVASGDLQVNGGVVRASQGGLVQLDARGSTDEDHDALSFAWTMQSRPAGSSGTLPALVGSTLNWRPDAVGDYVLLLTVTDARGAAATQAVQVAVDNHAPVPNIAVGVTFATEPMTAPTQNLTLGATVVLDGSASSDPDGGNVSIFYSLQQKPEDSATKLVFTGRGASFIVDAQGEYRVRAFGLDAKGASFESIYVFQANNRAPKPVVFTGVIQNVANSGSAVVTTSLGYDVWLGASGNDPDFLDVTTSAWELVSKPAGSNAVLSAESGPGIVLSPDELGDYVVRMTSTDSKGAAATYTTTVRVNNRRPVADISTNATPQSQPSLPSLLLPLGTQVTLRGDTSVDADGDELTYAWSVDTRPAGSVAAPSSTDSASVEFTADREGSYVFRLRVTDTAGAFSERSITLNIGTHPPVAVVDNGTVTVLLGHAVQASAALSFDDDGDALSYQWSIDARPAGSTAAIASAAGSELQFTPDVAGLYVAAVTVNDGKSSSIAYVNVRVLAQLAHAVQLGYAPIDARYSSGLDKVVITATNPNSLRIVDPFTGAERAVPLPTGVKNFSLSPDGRLAVVLHEGLFSLVDLDTATLVRTTSSSGAQTDAFVTNAGIVHLIGQTGGQWVDDEVVTINGRTGVRIPQNIPYANGTFYGTQYGVFADRINKVFLMSLGLSPADITYFRLDPATNLVVQAADSPYHGDYPMNTPLFLSGGNQDLLFTSSGTYYRTDSLLYAGRLSGVTAMRSFSHSAALQEALALQGAASSSYPYTSNYPASYKRFTGSLLVPEPDLALPLIGGVQTYGIKIFHASSGAHVVLVQTGGAGVPNASGVQYHVIVR